jgi:hypothetical protein
MGWPTLVSSLAMLLALAALTQPVWTVQRTRGTDVTSTTYSGNVQIEEEWSDGTWVRTTAMPYASPNLDMLRIREAIATTYGIATVYVALLGLFALAQHPALRRRIPDRALSAFGTFVLFVGLAAIGYPAATLGVAASQDGNPAVRGFVGAAADGRDAYAWGVGAAWAMWAAATLLVMIVVVTPLAQSRQNARHAEVTASYPSHPP